MFGDLMTHIYTLPSKHVQRPTTDLCCLYLNSNIEWEEFEKEITKKIQRESPRLVLLKIMQRPIAFTLREALTAVKKGMSISFLLKNMDFFPPMVISMVGIGEESGSMEDMLSKTADYYDEELDASIQKMLALLEPLLILFMGVIVGFIVISMMLPIFDMTKTVG